MNWIKKHKLGMIVLIITIILLILIAFTAQGRERLSKGESFVSRAVVPVQKTLYSITYHIKNFFGSITEVSSLRDTNEKLQKEIIELKKNQVELETLKSENERLKKLLNFQKKNSQYNYITAEIVSIDPEVWFDVFIIDKGFSDGIQKNMPICVEEGLVGKVIEVGENTSKILAISDTGNMVNGEIARTGDYIRIQGNGNSTLEGYVDPDVQLIPGDMIITSGLGNVFPENLIIGEVKSIEKQPGMLEKKVNIVPAVDLKQLKEVLILKKK
ncbi:rod shape-determining protein MreC [Garciella nitratireducens]|uniref:rod shape-determining protein MreC n=1 Tax=Garciella nitratireducens TaxID=218205 RepID=UPI001BD553F4|nr:rod shape-determining protein MreC [Garciella nitratireducens]